MLSKQLLEILCCPKCHGVINYEPEKNTLTCTSCKKIYPVKDDIPIMLLDEEAK